MAARIDLTAAPELTPSECYVLGRAYYIKGDGASAARWYFEGFIRDPEYNSTALYLDLWDWYEVYLAKSASRAAAFDALRHPRAKASSVLPMLVEYLQVLHKADTRMPLRERIAVVERQLIEEALLHIEARVMMDGIDVDLRCKLAHALLYFALMTCFTRWGKFLLTCPVRQDGWVVYHGSWRSRYGIGSKAVPTLRAYPYLRHAIDVIISAAGKF
jgi:hypothetical protein